VVLLLGLPPALVLAAALALPALEASALVGLVVPGETAVFVAGMAAHAGALPLWAAMLAGAAGAVAGDQVGFLLGRRWGPALLDRLPARLSGGAPVARASALIQRRGAWAVLLGRWTAVLRALVPGVAGASRLRPRTFVLANLLGGTTWAVAVAALGYGAGTAYQQVVDTLGRAGQVGVGAVVVLALAVAVVRRVRRRRRGSMAAEPAPRELHGSPRR